MKHQRRMLVALLALAMLFSLTAPAFAVVTYDPTTTRFLGVPR